MQNDSLYRVSLKCLIQNDLGEVLVVKESGRESWDLPGGGIDQSETIKECLARELKEEVSYVGDFTYNLLAMEEPRKLRTREVWQIRVIVKIYPENLNFKVGIESDAVSFVDPTMFKQSPHDSERAIYEYAESNNA